MADKGMPPSDPLEFILLRPILRILTTGMRL